jgi:hypothetical protein
MALFVCLASVMHMAGLGITQPLYSPPHSTCSAFGKAYQALWRRSYAVLTVCRTVSKAYDTSLRASDSSKSRARHGHRSRIVEQLDKTFVRERCLPGRFMVGGKQALRKLPRPCSNVLRVLPKSFTTIACSYRPGSSWLAAWFCSSRYRNGLIADTKTMAVLQECQNASLWWSV